MNKFNKLPTSQLVFYMTNSELTDEKLKLKIEETLFGRLTKNYKLYPNKATTFVERETEVISKRGYKLDSYAFGKYEPYEQLFKLFYENAPLEKSDYDINKVFNNLTMSEIIEFYIWFETYEKRFNKRYDMFKKEIEKNDRIQEKTLNKNRISFDTKKQIIYESIKLQNQLYSKKENEYILISYNRRWALSLFLKLSEIMGYGDSIRLTQPLKDAAHLDAELKLKKTISIEKSLLTRKSSIFSLLSFLKSTAKLYKDSSFDAYDHFTDYLGDNIRGYSFVKKK